MQTALKTFAVGFLTLIATDALGATSLLWSERSGVVLSNQCSEIRLHPSLLDARMQGLISETLQVDRYLNLPHAPPGLTKTIWQASRSPDGPVYGLQCETDAGLKTYVSFDVYDPQTIAAVAQVAVTSEESSVLGTLRPPIKAKTVELAPLDLPTSVPVSVGSPQQVVCISSGSLNVRDESLGRVLFTVSRGEALKTFQSFGEKPRKTISGTTYAFVKVQFSELPSGPKTGWVPETYVKLESECKSVINTPTSASAQWVFPTLKRPTDSYLSGMRAFNASRSGGRRTHAACDLYRVKGEGAVAIGSGTVVRALYPFYEGTYAIEIKHAGGKIARYGEVTGKKAPNVKLKSSVSPGQVVGYVGKVNSNCCRPMLHFEMYKGTASGSLTQHGNKYNRRKDLMDPTTLLREWERATFGASY